VLRFNPNLRWLFTEFSMLDRYEAASKAGFRGVEVAFPYEYPAAEIAGRLRDNDLTLVQILSPFDWDGGERGIAAIPDRIADFRRSIETAVAYAVQVGKPMIHVMTGNVPAGLEWGRCWETFLANLDWAAPRLARESLTLILEPCCRARFPDYHYSRLDQGVAAIRSLPHENIKLCYDTFHVRMEEGELLAQLESVYPDIGHIQIGNVPGRHEPGTGEIHFTEFFERLEVLGWSGWIGCEYTPSGHTLDTLSWGSKYGVLGRA
jgi:hydroxypyruvate isomerase